MNAVIQSTPPAIAGETLASSDALVTQQLPELNGLRPVAHLPSLDKEGEPFRLTDMTLARVLRHPQLKTVMVLDPEGVADSYNLPFLATSSATTIMVRPGVDGFLEPGRSKAVYIEYEQRPVSECDPDSRQFAPLVKQVDLLALYHSGTFGRENLLIADKLLAPNGFMVEYFIPPDGSPTRFTTYYSQAEIENLLSWNATNKPQA